MIPVETNVQIAISNIFAKIFLVFKIKPPINVYYIYIYDK